MRKVNIEDVKKGDYVRRKPDAKTTFVRGEYCRSDKKYEISDFEDMNRWVSLKKGTAVFVDFDF